ncbi:heme biosynthesis protein HemY [Psychromonas sp. KJ10-10]|uniref:heme biosynthesis protein HemY n=1 Tax=Psychromonas sp. KJ10-10 TaxID=3391823 RepID=UPI0039B5F358
MQGLYDQRNEHLVLASESNKDAHLSVGLVSVELQIDAKQYEGALATLRELALKFPSNPRISQLYLDIYPELNEWEKYIRVLNNHYKQLDYNAEQIAQLELNAYQHFFKQLALEDVESLKLFWEKKLPRRLRKELNYQKAMLDAYIESDNGQYAQELLIEKLNKQVSLPLLTYLDKVVLSDYEPLIELLEKKMRRFEEKGLIYQALAKLKLKEGDTEGAIKDLELSLESESNVESCALLARLLEEDERFDDANRYYRLGLQLATKTSTGVIKLP